MSCHAEWARPESAARVEPAQFGWNAGGADDLAVALVVGRDHLAERVTVRIAGIEADLRHPLLHLGLATTA